MVYVNYQDARWASWTTSSNTVTITPDPWQWQTMTAANTVAYSSFQNASSVWYDTCREANAGRTPEEQEAYEADLARRVEEAAERERERQRVRAEADQRAQVLLLEHLEPDERERWLQHHEVHVRSQSGRRYCIKGHKRMHNIFELNDEGRAVKELCVYAAPHDFPSGDLPLADNVLAQKLGLEYAEEAILARANTWELAGAR